MTKKSLKHVAVGLVTGVALMMASFAPMVQAQGFGSTADSPTAISTATGGQTSFRSLALTIVNFFLTFLGLIAVVMIIYGGFLYVTAAGNQEHIEKAKKIIIYAVVGILVILASYAIVSTILGAGGGGTTS